MIYAQIKDGVVVNTIVLEDDDLLPLFQTNLITGDTYDHVLLIQHLYPRPGIGWTFDDIQFFPPQQSEDPVVEEEDP